MYIISHDGGRLRRYLYCSYKTIATVLREKPDVVFAQNPSVVLNYLLLLTRVLFPFMLVTDAHFGGIIAYNGNYFFQKALDLCNRLADLVIVTNKGHSAHVKSIAGNAFICEDPLPDLEKYDYDREPSDKTVFFICSFDIDEPYNSVFEAAKILSKDNYKFYVSGNYTKVGIDSADYPDVNFLGFVPEYQFYEQLFLSDIVLDLTEHENCLVCGAYEAMAAEKPLVTSDKICLREYFDQGTIFTKHDSESIVEAVRLAYQGRSRLKEEIRAWKVKAVMRQNERKTRLLSTLNMN